MSPCARRHKQREKSGKHHLDERTVSICNSETQTNADHTPNAAAGRFLLYSTSAAYQIVSKPSSFIVHRSSKTRSAGAVGISLLKRTHHRTKEGKPES